MRALHSTSSLVLGGLALAALTGGVLGASPATADSVSDFYRGKTMKILVGYPPAGSYTAYAQLAARHYGKYIPGNPNVIVQNMPGAGSLVAANYFSNVAPKDGTMIGMFADTLAVSQLLFPDKAKFDAKTFPYIGSFTPINPILMIRSDANVKSFKDALSSEVIVGCTGAGSQSYIMPRAMKALLGAKFKMICGYRGSAAQTLALIRGEIQAQSSAWASWRIRYLDEIKQGKLIPLVQVGLKPETELPDLVLMHELTDDPDKKRVLQFLSIGGSIGRAFNAPPGLPADRLKALREAFGKMVKDPALLADAKKQRANIEPETGEALDKMTIQALSTPPNLVKLAQESMVGYEKNCTKNCEVKKKKKKKE
ncbi:MAG TPA: tripartite tricarboxylate transporter substrate-binding protein [Alphaproteobacteria bacterium]